MDLPPKLDWPGGLSRLFQATGWQVAPMDFMNSTVTCCRSSYAVARCYTTRRRNAHGTGVEREVLYPWHPWTGRQIHIHEVIEKGDVAVFRCSFFLGRASDRWLDIPAWMFARVVSANWRIAARQPHIPLVPKRAIEQRDIQALHRARQRMVNHRTAVVSRSGPVARSRLRDGKEHHLCPSPHPGDISGS